MKKERYGNLTRSFFRASLGVLLCFDMTNSKSWKSIPRWLNQLTEQLPNEPILIVGTKGDLISNLQVMKKEIQSFCADR
ncbi:hypothetical protein, partial [Vibrio cholerae]|uniref:hypothetical protein n=1 Tax=Vibrio cholerae TaxID=666 RepID=UPI0018F0BBDF|nr:hypothetical protein [Vibrio cholerae]